MDFDIRAKYYNRYRKADTRLVKEIIRLLDVKSNSTILDVGAGTGNYSVSIADMGYHIMALEPEKKMIDQCSDNRINWINSSVYSIPLENNSVDGAIIINVIHHFKDIERAFQEIKRVVGKGTIVILTFDSAIACKQWIFDYWPALVEYEYTNYMEFEYLKCCLVNVTKGELSEYIFKLPYDFEDLFSASLWKRPNLLWEYGDIKNAMSLFESLDEASFQKGLSRLKYDVENHNWENKYAYLLNENEWDVGCRLLKLIIS